MMGKADIFQHYHPSERDFIERALDWLELVSQRYSLFVTPFLNPREVAILEQLARHQQIQTFSSRLMGQMESQKVILAPDYYQLDLADFDIGLIEISYPQKFAHLTHGQVLGTLLHQLGLKREIFGDILVAEGRVQVLVEARFTSFILDNINKIARVSVSLKEVPLNYLMDSEVEGCSKEVLLSSFRLDKLVAVAFHLSRKVAVKLIETGRVKLNYANLDQPSSQVALGDLISVRGYGRCQIIGENGLSKSGKYKLTLYLIESKK